VVDLLAEQVEFANQIIVNKADLVSAAELDRLTQLLACLNPEARIVVTMFGHVNVDDLLDTRLYEREGDLLDGDPLDDDALEHELNEGFAADDEGAAGDDLRAEQAAVETEASFFAQRRSSRFGPGSLGPFAQGSPAQGSPGQGSRTHTELDIKSFVYRARRPFHPGRLWAYLEEAWPGVLRSKGLFWLATRMNESGLWSQAGKACSHQSAGRWWSSVPRELWPEDDTLRASILAEFRGPFGDRRQEIVVIGQNLDESALRVRLDACLIDPFEMRLGPLGWAQLPDPFPAWETESNDDGELPAPILRRETPTA
jgi:G3E family GTPase